MVTGKAPFRASSEQETLDAVRMKEPNFPEQMSPLLTVSEEEEKRDFYPKRPSVVGLHAIQFSQHVS